MAGSRVHKLGSIYSRVNGLLRAGAMKEIDKPLWYNVFQAFPPSKQPTYNRPVEEANVRTVLYREDVFRAHFYRTYGQLEVTHLEHDSQGTQCKRFTDKCCDLEINSELATHEDIYKAAEEELMAEGMNLKTFVEIRQEVQLARENREKHRQLEKKPLAKVSVTDIFGDVVASKNNEEKDYVAEDLLP